ncbi:MAG TPA: zinc-ribbon domain containing protein [Candidatus Wallbacteria bacterium]|nr:zinc-ribbon domain containing protein [Candidatus Wallbacteria bacterium]
MAEFQDKNLVCKECSSEFVFTVSEQNFYSEKGFENEPTRCPECRAKRKKGSFNQSGQKEFTETKCSECGKDTRVPFVPTPGKPVYCRECFQAKR